MDKTTAHHKDSVVQDWCNPQRTHPLELLGVQGALDRQAAGQVGQTNLQMNTLLTLYIKEATITRINVFWKIYNNLYKNHSQLIF